MLPKYILNFDEIVTKLLAAGTNLEEMDEEVSHLLLTFQNRYDRVMNNSDEKLNLVFVENRLIDHEVKLETKQKNPIT